MNKKQVTTSTIKDMKQQGEPITMVTAYDYAMARNVNEAGIDMILIGDSLGNVMLGYNSTVPVTMEEMIHHTKAVMRANGAAMVVADMPFMSYQASLADGMYNAARLLKEGGCAAVKLEGGSEICELVAKLVRRPRTSAFPTCISARLRPLTGLIRCIRWSTGAARTNAFRSLRNCGARRRLTSMPCLTALKN